MPRKSKRRKRKQNPVFKQKKQVKCKLIVNGYKLALCEGCKIYWNIPWQNSEKGYECPNCSAKGGEKDDRLCENDG